MAKRIMSDEEVPAPAPTNQVQPPPGVKPVSLMDRLKAGVSKQFGQDVYTATEQQRRMFGIEIPSLAVQWCIHSNILPLQSIISYEGPPKVYKTSAALEIARWFLSEPINGMAYYVGTEGKLSPTKVSSMLGPHLTGQLQLKPCATVEAWQDASTQILSQMGDIVDDIRKGRASSDKKVKAEYANAFLPPVAIIVDSVGGVQSESIREGIMDEGHANKTFQDRALINTMWLNTWASNMNGLPVTVVLMNHLKDKMEKTGHGEQKTSPGGVGLGFHTSLCIRVSRVGDIKTTTHEGAKLSWKVHFSSIGLDKRSLEIHYIETYDEQDNQLCYFDWNQTLVNLLLELKGVPQYAALNEALQLVEYGWGNRGKAFSCAMLGIKGEEAAKEAEMTANKLGTILQDPKQPYRAQLQKLMHIQQYQAWEPGIDLTIPREGVKPVKAGKGGKKKDNTFAEVPSPE